MVCAAIYYNQWASSVPTMIIWIGVVAYVASIPIPYVVGNLFFRRIYNIELKNFTIIKNIHKKTNKKKHEEK
jgi:hypothetical protein